MADDDDWETDADFENNLTEAEQRAYGNAETKARYEQVMEKSGATAPGESLKGVTMAPATAPPTPPPSLPVVATAAAGDFTAPPSAYEPVKAPTPTKLDLKSVFNTSMKNMSPKPLEGVASTPSGSASKNVLNRTRRISDQQAKELADVFKSFDTDGSETLTVDELEQAFNKLGMPTPKDKLTAMLKAADTDGNGKIDFNEFVSMAERIKAQKGTKDAISAGFTEMVDKGKAKIQQVSSTECHRVPPTAADRRRLPPTAADCRRLAPSAAECRHLPPFAADCRRSSLVHRCRRRQAHTRPCTRLLRTSAPPSWKLVGPLQSPFAPPLAQPLAQLSAPL